MGEAMPFSFVRCWGARAWVAPTFTDNTVCILGVQCSDKVRNILRIWTIPRKNHFEIQGARLLCERFFNSHSVFFSR